MKNLTAYFLIVFSFIAFHTSKSAIAQDTLINTTVNGEYSAEITIFSYFPGDPDFNGTNDSEWTYLNDASDQDSSSNNNNGNPIDPFFYYLVRITHQNGTYFEIRLKEDAIVLQQDPDIDQLGIFMHLKSTISLTNFSEVGFNDSKVYVQTINRLSTASVYESFHNNLATRLDNYVNLFDWENMVINGNWQEEIDNPTPCELAIIDLVKTLVINRSFRTKEESIQIFDAIRAAQETFKLECPQRL